MIIRIFAATESATLPIRTANQGGSFAFYGQVLHSANRATSFSQRSHIIQPTKLTLPPNEVESLTQRNRIFCPAQSYLYPNAVISIDSMKRMNLLNDVHDFIYLLKLAAHYTLSYILA